jgi:hypothetical protein
VHKNVFLMTPLAVDKEKHYADFIRENQTALIQMGSSHCVYRIPTSATKITPGKLKY